MYPLVLSQERGCPTQSCPRCGSNHFKRNGFFSRKGDSRAIQRFICKDCKRSFSRAGYSPWYRHRHRRLNAMINTLLVNSNTIRGTGRILKINKDTVSRHLQVLAEIAREDIQRTQSSYPPATHVQMDDLITYEHSRLKQVSVTLITDADRYRMLGICVSRIPCPA